VPDSRSTLEVLVDVKNAEQGADKIRGVGKAAEGAGKSADQAGGGFGGMAKNLAVAAGGAIAIRKGYDFLKGAADQTAQLAKSTSALTRTTGMDTRTASAWVSMAKNRNIETDSLNRAFTTFSKQIRGAEGGSKAAAKAFGDLGIQADALKGMKTEDALMAVSDAFNKLPAGADKAALAQQLFGRQAKDLLPLLNLGSEGLAEQMKVMEKHGLVMDEAGVKKGLELAKAQRELSATTDGLKVSIGTALIPVLVGLANAILPVVSTFANLIQSSPLLTTAVTVLAGAITAIIVVVKLWSIAQMVLNSALLANPIGLVVLAVMALVAAFVLAYNKVSWFRAGVDAAFKGVKTVVGAVIGFVKNNLEKILVAALATPLAPIAAIVLAFTKWRGSIGGVISFIVDKVKALGDAVGAVLGPLGKAVDLAGKVGGGALSAIGSVLPFQHGGVMGAGGGLALVGERGPELMQLPGGTRVTPLQAGTQQPVDMAGLGFGEIHVHLDVDGRELAYVVARETDIQKASR
jgi:hypothetical protein